MDILKNRGESATPFKVHILQIHKLRFCFLPDPLALGGSGVDFLHVRLHFTWPPQVQQEIAMPAEAPTDFAVGLHLSEKHGVVFMITKARQLEMTRFVWAKSFCKRRVNPTCLS